MDPLTSTLGNLSGSNAADMLQGRIAKMSFAEPDPSAVQGAGTPGSVIQSFGELLNNQIHQVNQMQVNAEGAAEAYATGGDIPIHSVIVAVEKAEISLQFALQVRNKLVQAYQDLSHMQL
jgi:flagellar hook-basal body complex protein FliE